MARITQKTCTKSLTDPNNHDGMITHLQPDILECEVKRALGSITMNKASGGDGIPAKLFQILTQYASKFGKLSSGHRTGKYQFLFQSQRKAMPKNTQTTAQLYSSHMLAKWSEVKWSRSVVSDSLRPHGLQPTRLLHPWDFPGKSTGVGCHFLLQVMTGLPWWLRR